MASIFVEAPADLVFEAIAYLPRHADWASHDLKIEPVDNSPLAIGKKYTSLHAKADEPDRVTVTELVLGQRFGFLAVMANGIEMSHTMTVSEESGGALVTREPRIAALPGLKMLLRPVIALVGISDTKKNLKSMKAVLERFAA